MATDDMDLRLDGNSAAGLLDSLFRMEMTLAEICCSGCRAVGQVGALMRYGHETGLILRCPTCDTAVARLTRIRDHYWLDLRGTVSLRVPAPA